MTEEQILNKQLEEIQETEKIIKLKISDIADFVETHYTGFTTGIIKQLVHILKTNEKIERTGEFKLPNLVVVRLGNKSGFDIYYTNNFRYIMRTIKLDNKRILLIKS